MSDCSDLEYVLDTDDAAEEAEKEKIEFNMMNEADEIQKKGTGEGGRRDEGCAGSLRDL